MAAFELLVESETPDTELTCRTGEAGGHKTGRRDSGLSFVFVSHVISGEGIIGPLTPRDSVSRY